MAASLSAQCGQEKTQHLPAFGKRCVQTGNRLISDTQKKVFSKIFNTLETGLSKLGDSTSNQTKAIRDLIQLIKDIPTDQKILLTQT